MPVKRAEHLGHYTIVDNGFLNDKGLSLKAKGLLTLMLSLPDTWKYSVRGLAKKMQRRCVGNHYDSAGVGSSRVYYTISGTQQ